MVQLQIETLKECIACLEKKPHDKFDRCDCGYCFEEEKQYFEASYWDNSDLDRDVDGDPIGFPAPFCSCCQYQFSHLEDFMVDSDQGIHLCFQCWKDKTGNFLMSKQSQRILQAIFPEMKEVVK